MPFFKRNLKIVRLSLFFVFTIFLSIFCTNCYLDTEQLEKSSLNYDDIGNNGSTSNISNNGGGGFNPSGFSWNNVHFINGGVIVNRDISGWSETSRITSFSMSSNGICVDHTMKNTWSTIIHPGYSSEPWETQGSPWIFIPMDDGKIYAKGYEHLRSKNDPVMGGRGGQACKLGVRANTLAKVISNLVDHTKSIHLTGQAQRDAIRPIKDWYPQPGDILGFVVSTYGGTSGDYRSGSQNERSDIVWIRVPDYNTVNSGGQIVGRTSGSSTTTNPTTTTTNSGNGNPQSSIVGQCGSTPNTCLSGTRHLHPKDTLTKYLWTCRNIPRKTGKTQCEAPRNVANCGTSSHFKVVQGRCLPSCGALAYFKNVGKQDHQLQASQCSAGWTRLGDSYEEAQNGNSVCCGRNSGSGGQSSNVCLPSQRSPHYKDVNGQCLPSCGHAANMAGYGGYGPDGQPRTSDDPHVYGSNVSSCANLTRFGHSDWKDFSWTDKRTSKTMNNSQIHSVILRGGVCCVRGNPTRRTPRRRPPTTTTTTTTTTQSNNGSNSQQMPNLYNVVRRLARQHPQALRNLGGNPFDWGDYVFNQQKNVQSMEFLDRVIQKLHSIDPRFGYIRKMSGRHGEFFGPDDIAYYEGVGNPQGKNMNQGTIFVDHITIGGNPNTLHGWIKVTDYPANLRPLAQWIYPRPGAPNYGYDPNHPGSVVR